MESNYWSSSASRRLLTRRRFMQAISASAAGAAALSLIGCGGSKSQGEGAALILANEQDTTKEAKAGGIYQDSYASEIANMDPLFITGNVISHMTPVYGNLLSAGLSTTE